MQKEIKYWSNFRLNKQQNIDMIVNKFFGLNLRIRKLLERCFLLNGQKQILIYYQMQETLWHLNIAH